MKNNILLWFCEATGARIENDKLIYPQKTYFLQGDVWKSCNSCASENQKQTEKVFGFKWAKEEIFDSNTALSAHTKKWLAEKYGNVQSILDSLPPNPIVLDAGCGASLSALAFFGSVFNSIHYIGVDISSAIHIAAKRTQEIVGEDIHVFLQENLMHLPFKHNSVDCIFSEGVLHHTDSTREAIAALTPLLKQGGLFMFYVYKKKTPIREFTDDYIREQIQAMSPQEAWDALKPLTSIGIQLGKIDKEISLPNGFPLLGIPAGTLSLQRFFYWHICKMFYRSEMPFDEMHHINFDWFAPKNAFRQSPEEVRSWCKELNLNIESMYVEDAGITVIARKKD